MMKDDLSHYVELNLMVSVDHFGVADSYVRARDSTWQIYKPLIKEGILETGRYRNRIDF
jgi:hypothetical protein